MQSIDLIEKNAYGMIKDLVSKKETLTRKNIIKQYKNYLTLIILQKKTKKIIQVGDKFLTIYRKF